MVSYHPNPLPMYSKNHTNPLPYPPPHSWYASGYPPPTHPGSNMQYLGGNGGGPENDAAAYYNQYHHMLHPTSPDWSAHDYQPLNSPNMTTAMVPSAAATTSQMHQNHNGDLVDNEGMVNVPPSPPNTVNSGCSEMSSPTSRVPSGGNQAMHDTSASPKSTACPQRPSNSKSPYEWMKKPSYHNHPTPGEWMNMFIWNYLVIYS